MFSYHVGLVSIRYIVRLALASSKDSSSIVNEEKSLWVRMQVEELMYKWKLVTDVF